LVLSTDCKWYHAKTIGECLIVPLLAALASSFSTLKEIITEKNLGGNSQGKGQV
jgi:hypothetical protein